MYDVDSCELRFGFGSRRRRAIVPSLRISPHLVEKVVLWSSFSAEGPRWLGREGSRGGSFSASNNTGAANRRATALTGLRVPAAPPAQARESTASAVYAPQGPQRASGRITPGRMDALHTAAPHTHRMTARSTLAAPAEAAPSAAEMSCMRGMVRARRGTRSRLALGAPESSLAARPHAAACARASASTYHAARAAHLSLTRRSLCGRSQCRARGHAMRVRCGRMRRIQPAGRDLARGSPRAMRRIHRARSALSSLRGRCCWHARACRRCRSAIGSAGVVRCA